jgi:S-adenosylmethionine/arginine decarboxylase-like enzyme
MVGGKFGGMVGGRYRKENLMNWKHLLIEGINCDNNTLNDMSIIYNLLDELPNKMNMEKLGTPILHRVTPTIHKDTGITGVTIITTSHIAIHTFNNGNEQQPLPFFTFDAFSCKDFDERIIIAELNQVFKPKVKLYLDR